MQPSGNVFGLISYTKLKSYNVQEKMKNMKRLLFILLIGLFTVNVMNAQWGNNSNGTLSNGSEGGVKWEQKIIDIGDVKQYNPQEVVYKFTNTGGKPIIITGAKGSCGCTDILYSQKPILPGQTAEITVNFDAETLGVFNKTVTLTMNIENSSQVLRLKGTVIR